MVLQSNEEESLQDVVVTFRGWTPSMGQKSRHDILYMEKRLDLPEALNLKTGKLPPGELKLCSNATPPMLSSPLHMQPGY